MQSNGRCGDKAPSAGEAPTTVPLSVCVHLREAWRQDVFYNRAVLSESWSWSDRWALCDADGSHVVRRCSAAFFNYFSQPNRGIWSFLPAENTELAHSVFPSAVPSLSLSLFLSLFLSLSLLNASVARPSLVSASRRNAVRASEHPGGSTNARSAQNHVSTDVIQVTLFDRCRL